MNDDRAPTRTVGEMAGAARVSVRTLHHYDEIGLLVPSDRTDAGYRLYAPSDLERLHQILLYRELGFGLEDIRRILDEPLVDRAAALKAQRDALRERKERTEALLRAVDRTLESLEGGSAMSPDELNEDFDAFANAPEDVKIEQAKHGSEVRRRWGDGEAFAESRRRVRGFSDEDWKRIRAESETLEERMAGLMARGVDPRSGEARAVAEEMRLHVCNFYACSHAMHAGLADMYEADPRFAAHYDERGEGLASYVATAIRANATGR